MRVQQRFLEQKERCGVVVEGIRARDPGYALDLSFQPYTGLSQGIIPKEKNEKLKMMLVY